MNVLSMKNAPQERAALADYWSGMMAAVQGRPGVGSETFMAGYRDAYAQMEQQTEKALEYEQ